MEEYEERIQSYFQRRVADWPAASPLHAEAVQLAQGELHPDSRAALASVYAFEDEPELREAELDLLLDFVRESLGAGGAPRLIAQAMVHLKRYFGVEEGDFIAVRSNDVAAIISAQLDRILEDGQIDSSEDLEQVELQQTFDLSYDEYLILGRAAFERAVVMLEHGSGLHPMETEASRRRKLELLLPVYKLATQRGRTPGALY